MEGTDTQYDNLSVDTNVFVVVENESDFCDFVTIDEDTSYDAVVIDMSQFDFIDSFIVNFNEDADADVDSFVTIDDEDEQVFVSDFRVDDF
jgi:hypothetical protein